MSQALTEPAKLLLLIALLSKDRIISNNGKAFMKDLILRRDPRLKSLIEKFEMKETNDMSFLEQVHDLIADEAGSMYNDLFCDTSLEVGKALSKNEREMKKLSEEKSLIYGEVEFASFYRVLRKINPAPGLVFYDLGSGTGKAVFAARLTQDFSKCIGIEILHSLHTQASLIVNRYNAEFKSLLALGQSQYANVFEGSLTDFDWSNGDVVFANSTCFSDELMAELSQQAERLKPGAIVVTFTKGMTSKAFEVLERKRHRMSWGPATVYIHRRLNHNGTPVGPSRLNLLPSDAIDYDNDSTNNNHSNSDGSLNNNRNTFPPSYSTTPAEDDDDTSYDEDIDYDIRQTEDEEDNDDDVEEEEEDDDDQGREGDDEDNDDNDQEDDYDEDLEEEEEQEEETEESPAKTASSSNSPNKTSLLSSPPKNSPLSLKSPSTASSLPASGGAYSGSKESLSTPSKTATGAASSPKSNKGSAARIYPMGVNSPSARNEESTAANEFSSLNSPFDSALLMRKRKDPHNVPTVPASVANDFAALNSPYDSALLMRKRSTHNTSSKSED